MSAASYATCRSAWSPVQRAHRPSRQFNSTHISCALSQRAESSGPEPSAAAAAHPHLLARLRATAGGVVLAAALALSPVGAHQAHAESVTISNDTPVVDLARVVPSARLEGLQQQLLDLEQQTGWRVRMLTRFGNEGPSVEEMRAGWSTDERTVVVLVDPSAPNIMNFKFGREVRQVLRPQFFTELQGRYGNMFNVREQGESAAVMSMMDALTGCLARGGCFAVPGLTGDHYAFTLAVSVAGGLIAGAASKLEPYGFVQRRWVWVALFAPLWGTLFINFGIGPVVSRTADLMPLLGNAAGFAAAAAAVGFSPQVARAAGLTTDEDSA